MTTTRYTCPECGFATTDEVTVDVINEQTAQCPECGKTATAADFTEEADRSLFVDDEDRSLYGSCSHCHRRVDNYDEMHRVSAILRGGKGVECVLRGDIAASQGAPLLTALPQEQR